MSGKPAARQGDMTQYGGPIVQGSAGVRIVAINILTNDKVFKAGLRRKMRKAAMDRNYLASVLTGSGLS